MSKFTDLLETYAQARKRHANQSIEMKQAVAALEHATNGLVEALLPKEYDRTTPIMIWVSAHHFGYSEKLDIPLMVKPKIFDDEVVGYTITVGEPYN